MSDYYIRPVDQADHDMYMREAEWHAARGNWERSDRMVDRAVSLRRPKAQATGKIDPNLTSRAKEYGDPEAPRFYHGTANDLRPRTVIKPASQIGHPTNYPTYGNSEWAYAAESLPTAHGYADRALDMAHSRKQGHGKSRRIYEVAPIGEHEPDPNETNGIRSKQGFRVVRRIPASEWNKR
jgi:Rifampin ADP-ribosyl transferase